MTLHITTITPNHVISVSDRLVATSGGYIELDNDRYKHLILKTDDARVIVTFAGFAGIPASDGTLGKTTIDRLTRIIQNTSSKGYHLIGEHIKDIFNSVSRRINKLKKLKKCGISAKDLRLAIVISGWIGQEQFNYVIDNCLEKAWTWSGKARDSFKARYRNYGKAKFKDGSYIVFLGNERLGLKQRALRRCLELYARNEEPEKIFGASVKIIRAASSQSKGTIGMNCSGVRISRNDPGIQIFNDRSDKLYYDVVMPNIITSTSKISCSVTDMKGKKTKPKKQIKLKSLIPPAVARNDLEKLSFWFRVIEKLRHQHNEFGAKVRKSRSKKVLNRFHQWQEDIFQPFQATVFEQINIFKQKLIENEPEKYMSNNPMNHNSFAQLKERECENTEWDEYIDLLDLEEFKVYI